MNVELNYSELSKIESALIDKIYNVCGFIVKCEDDQDCVKDLLEYCDGLHELLSKIEAKLYGL